MSYKVIQWTTGHVGKEAVKGILAHPDLKLVGTYAWSGMVKDEPAIQLDVVWKAGGNLEPDWPLFQGYTTEVEGNPKDPGAGGADLANQVTAMPVINAIPAEASHTAGIKTYADMPLIAGGYVR